MWIQMFMRLLLLAVSVQGKTECSVIGCVTDDRPYRTLLRPSVFPQDAKIINTRFFLYTQKNPEEYQVISAKNLSTFNESNFNCSKKTVFIIHGYTEKGDDHWLKTVCQKMLAKEDLNCVSVDWREGAKAPLFQAINNVQVVGAEVAYFINATLDKFNCSLSNITIIGHSMGGQAAGEAGKRRPGISKMIILDTMGPFFENEPNEVRVDRSDAILVFAIHTNAGLIGMKRRIGHIDFYPNGGTHMTGCDGSQIQNITESVGVAGALRDIVLCSHVASYYMFISSIENPGGLVGYCASSYSDFQKGAGFPCNGSCSLMGLYTEPPNASSCDVYYLNTGPRYDYSCFRLKVTVKTGNGNSIQSTIKVQLYNSTECSTEHKIYSGPVSAGSEYSAFVDSRCAPPVTRVQFSCNTVAVLDVFYNPVIAARFVTVTSGIDGAEYKFCGAETATDHTQVLKPCE